MIGTYTLSAFAATVAVIALELAVLRTGLFRDMRYWTALVIGLGFQIPVDGWLTRADDPIVVYAEGTISGLRFPMNIPVEDFGFGFALITFTLLLWRRLEAVETRAPDNGNDARLHQTGSQKQNSM
jgi:lycopene cyclase domain-containing protein